MTELDSARFKTIDLVMYLKFMLGFDLQSNYSTKEQNLLNDYLKNVSNTEIGLEVHIKSIEILSKWASPLIDRFPLKIPFNNFVKNIDELFTNKSEELNSQGVQAGWLREKMDLSNYIKPTDFPYHAYFGFGKNKGKFGVEEDILLKDAFNIFIRFNSMHEEVLDLMQIHQKKKCDLINKHLPGMHFEMSSYARLSILSFFAFFECFINGIAYDFLKSHESRLSTEEINLLQGRNRNGRGYLSIEKKLEHLQKIIRPDNEVIIRLTDSRQIKEPFKTLLSEFKELRNSSVHNSPLKTKIWVSAKEWYNKTSEVSKMTINASRLIWSALKGTNSPEYLLELDYEELVQDAQNRIQGSEFLRRTLPNISSMKNN